jgi:hypothetical protein
MTSRLLTSFLAVLSLTGTAWAQQPAMSVFPDSVNLWMTLQGTRVDSFRIANVGSDTLTYRVTFQPELDTTWYSNLLINGPPRTVDSLLRASIIRPRKDFILLDFEYLLSTQHPAQLEFFLFESSSLAGNYNRIFSRMHHVDSLTFNEYASSGPIDVKLHAGQYYALGVSWDQPVQYRYGGSTSVTGDGLDLQVCGDFSQTSTFPSGNTLFVSAVQGISGYDMRITGAFALWLELLTDSAGIVTESDTIVIPFRARDPGIYGHWELTSCFSVHSNDPIDSLANVAVTRRIVTGIERSQYDPTARYELEQNFPNPFNPTTTIKFSLPHATTVSLKVFDVLGREIATLASGNLDAGVHTSAWNTERISSGLYFYRLQSPTFVMTKKMLLLR